MQGTDAAIAVGAQGRRDLDAICRKCLAKQPRRRYPSALELADDLRRCANGYPIKARSASNAERFGKWLRRNFPSHRCRSPHPLGVVSLLVLLTSGDGDRLPSLPRREQDYRERIMRVETELAQVRQREAAANYRRFLTLAERESMNGEPARGREMLDHCPPDQRHWEWYYLHSRFGKGDKNDRLFINTLPVTSMDVSLDGQYLVVGGGGDPPNQFAKEKGDLAVWDLATGKNLWRAGGRICSRSGLQWR